MSSVPKNTTDLAKSVRHWNVRSCLEAQILLENLDAEFAEGFGCRNEMEVMAEINVRATNEFVEWFFDGDKYRCSLTVDAALTVVGAGVARAAVKLSTKNLLKKAREGAEKEELIFAAEEYAKTQNSLGAAGALFGVVFGETINEAVCKKMEEWARGILDPGG